MINTLTKRFGKYALVVGVAKRAKDLRERIDRSLEPSGGSIVKRALKEIARGDVKIRAESPKEEPE